jgi:hypothetical protein
MPGVWVSPLPHSLCEKRVRWLHRAPPRDLPRAPGPTKDTCFGAHCGVINRLRLGLAPESGLDSDHAGDPADSPQVNVSRREITATNPDRARTASASQSEPPARNPGNWTSRRQSPVAAPRTPKRQPHAPRETMIRGPRSQVLRRGNRRRTCHRHEPALRRCTDTMSLS